MWGEGMVQQENGRVEKCWGNGPGDPVKAPGTSTRDRKGRHNLGGRFIRSLREDKKKVEARANLGGQRQKVWYLALLRENLGENKKDSPNELWAGKGGRDKVNLS